MHWVIIAVIVVALLALSTSYPKIAFSTLGALLVGLYLLYLFAGEEGPRESSKIPLDEVELSHVRMEPGYADAYRLSARVSNASQRYVLSGITVDVGLLDCATDDPGTCTKIGEISVPVGVSVPPGQARDFVASVNMGPVAPRGNVMWQHDIVGTSAYR